MTQWTGNLVTLAILGLLLWAFIKLRKSPMTLEDKMKKAIASPAVPVKKEVIPGMTGKNLIESEEELLAVITAAIHAFTGSSEFKVISIRRPSNNWVLAGRQDIMNSRM